MFNWGKQTCFLRTTETEHISRAPLSNATIWGSVITVQKRVHLTQLHGHALREFCTLPTLLLSWSMTKFVFLPLPASGFSFTLCTVTPPPPAPYPYPHPFPHSLFWLFSCDFRSCDFSSVTFLLWLFFLWLLGLSPQQHHHAVSSLESTGEEKERGQGTGTHDAETPGQKCSCVFVSCLLYVPATCKCISGTDLHRQFYVLPHWDRSSRSNFLPYPVTVYWHRADQS